MMITVCQLALQNPSTLSAEDLVYDWRYQETPVPQFL